MSKYSDFLKKLKLPSEEEFNKLIEQLPPYEELSEDFEFDPDWDDLNQKLFDWGVLGDKYRGCWTDEVNLEEKKVVISDIDSFEDLNEINDMLKSAGWTLENYDEDLEYWNEQATQEKLDAEKQQLLDKLRDFATLDQLKEFVKNVNKG